MIAYHSLWWTCVELYFVDTACDTQIECYHLQQIIPVLILMRKPDITKSWINWSVYHPICSLPMQPNTQFDTQHCEQIIHQPIVLGKVILGLQGVTDRNGYVIPLMGLWLWRHHTANLICSQKYLHNKWCAFLYKLSHMRRKATHHESIGFITLFVL